MEFMNQGLKKTLYNQTYLAKLQKGFEEYRAKVEKALGCLEERKMVKLVQHKKIFSVVWLICSDLLLMIEK